VSNIIVNGGAGFIGHHICVALSKIGHKVVAVDRMSQLIDSPDKARYRLYIEERMLLLKEHNVEVVVVDTDDLDGYVSLIEKCSPNVIYHMSAIANARICNVQPHAGVTENLVKVENVLEAIRITECKARFVFASSSVAYGNFRSPEVKEDDVLDPINIYGYTKKSSEELVALNSRLYGLEYAIIRPSALYGPRCVNRRITQIIMEKYLTGEAIKINGDGEEELDFTFVDDTVQGFIKAGLDDKVFGEIFNITYGQSRSLNELIGVAKDNLPGLRVEYITRDNVMPFRGTLNVDKAKSMIGYDPQYPLEKGYPVYIEWYMKNRDKFNF